MQEAKTWSEQAGHRQLDQTHLTADRERQLLRAVQDGTDAAARGAALAELFKCHGKLVVAIARHYGDTGLELLDLVGAGHRGLHAAITHFVPERPDARLSGYAIAWIRSYVQDYVRRNRESVGLPDSSAHRQLADMHAQLFADALRHCRQERVKPTPAALQERVGQRVGLSADAVASAMRIIQGASTSVHRDDSGSARLADKAVDRSAAAEEPVVLRLDHAKARKRITELSEEILGERERAVFLARTTSRREDVGQLDDLAGEFGVSRDRIYQLEGSARRKIVTALRHEGFGDLLRDGVAFRSPPARARRRRAATLPIAQAAPRLAAAMRS